MHNKQRILLVGDIVEDNCALERPIFDEDNPSRSEVANLVDWISEVGYEVDVCEDICSFVEHRFSQGF